jgi:hypothetical protein
MSVLAFLCDTPWLFGFDDANGELAKSGDIFGATGQELSAIIVKKNESKKCRGNNGKDTRDETSGQSRYRHRI